MPTLEKLLIPPDPLSLVYNGIADAILADEFIKSLHDAKVIFLDFLPLLDSQNLTNPALPARDMPRMSLLPDSTTWQTNNSCTGRIDHTISVRIAGYNTRSALFNPLVFHLLKITRHLDGLLRAIQYQGNTLRTVSRGGTASYEHDDERLLFACTIPIEIQIYL